MHPVLITAGATRNPIDSIRHLSANSSGRTGLTIATDLAADHAVTLMGSAEACLRASSHSTLLDTEEFTSTRDLLTRMKRWVHDHPTGAVVHAAAVGDYEAQSTAGKIPSGQPELLLNLSPAPKILPLVKEWSREIQLVSFKAAPPGTLPSDLLAIARAQRDASGSHTVFANIIGSLDRGILVLHHDMEQWFDDRASALSHLSLSIRTV